MKATIYIIIFLCAIFSLCPELKAQDRPARKQSADLLPEYQVEVLNKANTRESIFIPLIYNGYLYSFCMGSEKPVWRMFIGGDLPNPFTTGEKLVFFYDIYNRVYSIDMYNGEMQWKINLENKVQGKLKRYHGYIFIPTVSGKIHVVNMKSGKVEEEYKSQEGINTSLSLHNDLLIVPYKNGNIIAYNMKNENRKWVFSPGGIVSIAPKVEDGRVFFGSWNEKFYALDAASGKTLWTSYVGEPINRDFITSDEEIILFFPDGEIICLNKKNGNIKWVKQIRNVNFNYNYFNGPEKFYIFKPQLIALDPDSGNVIFDYGERVYSLYKDMLFKNMIEGENPLSDEDKARVLSEVYYTVEHYPVLPPVKVNNLVYFVAEDSYFYVYDVQNDFFILKYKMS